MVRELSGRVGLGVVVGGVGFTVGDCGRVVGVGVTCG
jgi:hypothetical protein